MRKLYHHPALFGSLPLMSQRNAMGRQRMIALAIGSLLAAAIGFAAWNLRPQRGAVALVDNLLEQEAQQTSRQLMPRGLTPPSNESSLGAQLKRRVLTKEEVTAWFGLQGTTHAIYDPIRIFRYRGNMHETFPWPEYPGGEWTRVTNSEGAREDHEFPDPPPDLFVLVAGDSHTDGFCDNSASYSNLLELALGKSHAGKSVEVYNTGVSGYSFYNYLGVLESLLDRKPQVFVSTFFAGNDFFEALKAQHLYAGSVPPSRTRGYWDKVTRAAALSTEALAQGLNQLLYLRENPDQATLALQAARSAASEIQRLCAENNIDWIPVYLPSPIDLPFPEWQELRAHAKEALTLSDADFEIANQLADQLLATLRERGADVLDLRPIFRAQSQPLYWSDLHINLRGQEVVAQELLPRIEALLARRKAKPAENR